MGEGDNHRERTAMVISHEELRAWRIKVEQRIKTVQERIYAVRQCQERAAELLRSIARRVNGHRGRGRAHCVQCGAIGEFLPERESGVWCSLACAERWYARMWRSPC
jgi:hypothetical protein